MWNILRQSLERLFLKKRGEGEGEGGKCIFLYYTRYYTIFDLRDYYYP